MVRLLLWAMDRGFLGRVGPEYLASGRYLYAVTLARSGRIIEVVRVRADDEEEAALKAELYLRANIYARKIVRQEEVHADR